MSQIGLKGVKPNMIGTAIHQSLVFAGSAWPASRTQVGQIGIKSP